MIKHIKLLILLSIGLQLPQVHAAQESTIENNADHDTTTTIEEAVTNFPNLVEGFNILQKENLIDESFHNYFSKHVNQSAHEDNDEMPNSGDIITNAIDLVIEKMKDPFVEILSAVIDRPDMHIDQIKIPLFLYVMHHKDGFMQFPIKEWMNTVDSLGWRPLFKAAYHNNAKMMHTLITQGADVNAQDISAGYTPLIVAIKAKHSAMARILIDAQADITLKDKEGKNPVHWAASQNSTEILRMLIDAQADVNIQDNAGESPVHWAALQDSAEVLPMLINAQANINMINNAGVSPLHIATMKNNPKTARILIEAHAHLNIQARDGRTPLHLAAWENFVEVAQLLIAAKADLNLQNSDGFTPIHCAVGNNHTLIARMLINADADLSIQENHHGLTAEQLISTSEMDAVFINSGDQKTVLCCTIS